MRAVRAALKYQTFWPRFWASVIDSFVFVPVMIADIAVWSIDAVQPIRGPWFVVNQFSFVAYSIALHARSGQTIGKRVMGVVVKDVSEKRLSFSQAVLRDLFFVAYAAYTTVIGVGDAFAGLNPFVKPHATEAWFVGFGYVWLLVEIVTMLTNPKRRALHDWIAGSVVVRAAEISDEPVERPPHERRGADQL